MIEQGCQIGCSECTDGTGDCTSCQRFFYTQDPTDGTKCVLVPFRTGNGDLCPDGSFPSTGGCNACDPSCRNCWGRLSSSCTRCYTGAYFFNGSCITANSDGICQGANGMYANNNKGSCDSKSLLPEVVFAVFDKARLRLWCEMYIV